jgi:hypothetical protein
MPFTGPINSELSALSKAEARARDVKCSCPTSPWCRGQASADWATCSTSCRACKLPPWQPPVTASIQAGSGVLDADQG